MLCIGPSANLRAVASSQVSMPERTTASAAPALSKVTEALPASNAANSRSNFWRTMNGVSEWRGVGARPRVPGAMMSARWLRSANGSTPAG